MHKEPLFFGFSFVDLAKFVAFVVGTALLLGARSNEVDHLKTEQAIVRQQLTEMNSRILQISNDVAYLRGQSAPKNER